MNRNSTKVRLGAITVAIALLLAGGATHLTAAIAAGNDRIAFTTWPGCNSCASGVLVADADGGGLSLLARNTQDLVRSTSVNGPSWSPDARRLVYASNQCLLPFCHLPTGTVRIVNVDGSGDRKVASLSKMSVSGTAWSPGGGRIAFVGRADAPWDLGPVCWCSVQAGHAEIFVVDVDGSRLTPLAAGDRPTWSPDGRRLAFYGPDGGVYVVQTTGLVHVIRRISPPGFASNPSSLADYGWAGGPTWSPDGTRIAIVGNTATHPGTALDAFGWIYVVRSDGSNSVAPGWKVRGVQPTWSPDGSQLAYLDAVGIQTRPVGGGQARLVVANGPAGDANFYPTWSHDGGSIAYAHDRNGGWSIWRVTPDGSSRRLVTDALNSYSAIAPTLVWSPQ